MQQFSISIIAIGNELTTGRITDTNSSYLAKLLYDAGFKINRICLVEDEQSQIEEDLRRELNRSDLLITTGGLGPTSDDLTRGAISAVCGQPLEENSGARKKLEELFAARKRTLNENNLRQVQFPRGAEIVLNRVGTADAFITRAKNSNGKPVPILSLPGVPSELKTIYDEQVKPWLESVFPQQGTLPTSCSLKCFGRSESHLGQTIESCRLPGAIEVAYRPMFPEILITCTHRGSEPPQVRAAELRIIHEKIRSAIGPEFVFSNYADDTLPAVVGRMLREKGLTLAGAESCSGGLLADALVSLPGASDFFKSSVVAYHNDVKSVYLGVRPAVLEQFGAVSKETAVEMARGARFKCGADIGISITGIAGPDGGTPDKPVGTFWIGLATRSSEEALPHFYPFERNLFRRYTVWLALDLVRRSLFSLPLRWDRK